MLISGNAEVRKLFKGAKTTDRFTTELLKDGSIRLTKIDTRAYRIKANSAASFYMTDVERKLSAAGYETYYAKLSISRTVCVILKNDKLIYSGFSKCNMDKDIPDAAIGEALALWRAVSDTPFKRKLPEAIWNYVFNF